MPVGEETEVAEHRRVRGPPSRWRTSGSPAHHSESACADPQEEERAVRVVEGTSKCVVHAHAAAMLGI
jgi:hypothetical protein